MKSLIDLHPFMFSDAGAPHSDEWIQIMKVGTFNYKGKDISITQNDLNEFAENFHKKVRGVDLAVDISHQPQDGAIGWFEDVKAEPGRLMARVKWTDEGRTMVESGKFRYFSPEWMRQWTDESGKPHRNVLFGGAVTNRPFLKDMEPLPMAMSEDGMIALFFDPDHDGDDDSTGNPKKNPDWKLDVLAGITAWDKLSKEQQEQLEKIGASREACDAAYKTRQKQLGSGAKMTESGEFASMLLQFAEDDVKNGHKSPPKGYPTDKSQYADPDNFKYPIDEKHIDAAVEYFNHPGAMSKGGYTSEQWAEMGRKIASAANKLIGKGHEFKDGKISTPSNKMGLGSGDTGVKNLNPDDGSSKPDPINDGEAGKFSEAHTHSKNGGATMPVSDEQFNALAKKYNALEARLLRQDMTQKVNSWIEGGKLAPANRDGTVEMLVTMDESQIAKYSEMMDKAPKLFEFTEEGFSGSPGEADGDKLMSELMEQYARDGKTAAEAASMAWDEVHSRGLKVSGYDD